MPVVLNINSEYEPFIEDRIEQQRAMFADAEKIPLTRFTPDKKSWHWEGDGAGTTLKTEAAFQIDEKLSYPVNLGILEYDGESPTPHRGWRYGISDLDSISDHVKDYHFRFCEPSIADGAGNQAIDEIVESLKAKLNELLDKHNLRLTNEGRLEKIEDARPQLQEIDSESSFDTVDTQNSISNVDSPKNPRMGM